MNKTVNQVLRILGYIISFVLSNDLRSEDKEQESDEKDQRSEDKDRKSDD